MAAFLRSNEVEIERTGVSANVPYNDVARLMYYLHCACTSIDCNDDAAIQRFTNYQNWSYLSLDEKKALVVLCYSFSPDVLDNKVFFQSDELCGNSTNQFYKISQLRHEILASESIVIAGRTRQVNKIMTYKMQWMTTYYIEPMRRLLAQFESQSRAPAITYTPTYSAPSSRPPVIRQPIKKSSKCSCKCVVGFICCIIVTIIIISAIVSVTKK
ncbi:unnamed protein product [Rotaria socialis]|uniref:Uncharacterized protein n=1 Tax=Rotaria socialis TaxID=392032 RepID=A0A818RUR0_9BILA|nr:unnamed protein product [Rotaria socialis]CAF3364627.1 unnamed protein product [Rotaria socialis]CAF3374396.1 unnamed protein product [Rotaria socialis]CAF3617012.1 unnamed protein product [Rotaria socialis]CAF3658921.1 unnamed protein product [Rotaria socialis]